MWAVLEGAGTVRVSTDSAGRAHEVTVTQTGAYPLLEHERHTAGVLELSRAGLRCIATCFTPRARASAQAAEGGSARA